MSNRITVIKYYRNKETLRPTELQEVANMISKGEYQKEVSDFRRSYPIAVFSGRKSDGSIDNGAAWVKALPRICFA